MNSGELSRALGCVIAGAMGAGMWADAAAAQALPQQVIAVSGTAAPGTESGTTFYVGGLGVPTVNARGDVAFGAMLDVASKDWFRAAGIWYAPAGGSDLTLAYRVPSYSAMAKTPFLDDQGRIAFWTSDSPAELRVGVPGQYRTIVRSGDPAPGATGWKISGGGSVPVLSGSGDLYFEPNVTGSGPTGSAPAAYTVVGGGSPQLLRHSLEPTPDVPGAAIGAVDGKSFASGGHAAFATALYYGPSVPSQQGVFSGTAGNLRAVAIQGQAAPGLGRDYTFTQFMPQTGVNAAGTTVFTGVVQDSAKVASGTYAYLYDGQQLAPIAGKGTPVPALGAGVTLRYAQSQSINDRGQVLVNASAVGPNAGDAAFTVWLRWAKGVLTPIVRDGQAAPGLGAGVTLTSPLVLSFNGAGQTLIQATLAGPGVDSSNSASLWAVDPLGQFALVARSGMTLKTAVGDRLVTALRANAIPSFQPGNVEPLPQSLSDSGQVAWQAVFGWDGGNVANVLATLPAVIPGDANNDLLVDTTDFEILYHHLYQPGDRTVGDFNGDGRVSFTDFQILERNFGRSVDGTTTGGGLPSELAAMVPEPSAAALVLGMGVLALGPRRRRSRAVAGASSDR